MNTKFKFTQANLDALPFELKGKQELYWDEDVTGFGLRVGEHKKSYFIQGRLNGETVRVSVGDFKLLSLKDARAKAKTYLVKLQSGIHPTKQDKKEILAGLTLGDAYEQFKAQREHKLKPATVKNYDGFMRKHLSDWKCLPLSSISREMIVERHAKIGLKARSAADHTMRFVGTLYEYFSEDDNPLINPVKVLVKRELYQATKKINGGIDEGNVSEWMDAVFELQNRSMKSAFIVLLFTGLRKQECLKLEWSQLNFKNKVIRVEDTKNNKLLEIPMTEQLYTFLNVIKNGSNKHAKWVFPSDRTGGRITNLKSAVNIIGRDNDINFVAHDTRRAFATFAYEVGVQELTISRLINHTLLKGITSRYINITKQHLYSEAQKIADFIDFKVSFANRISELELSYAN